MEATMLQVISIQLFNRNELTNNDYLWEIMQRTSRSQSPSDHVDQLHR